MQINEHIVPYIARERFIHLQDVLTQAYLSIAYFKMTNYDTLNIQRGGIRMICSGR